MGEASKYSGRWRRHCARCFAACRLAARLLLTHVSQVCHLLETDADVTAKFFAERVEINWVNGVDLASLKFATLKADLATLGVDLATLDLENLR